MKKRMTRARVWLFVIICVVSFGILTYAAGGMDVMDGLLNRTYKEAFGELIKRLDIQNETINKNNLEIANKDKEINDIKDKLTVNETETAKLKESLDTANKDLESIKNDLASKKDELDKKDGELNKLLSSVAELNKKIEELGNKNNESNKTNEEVTKENGDLPKENETLTDENEALKKENETLTGGAPQ